jgi:hypothetical protein
VYCEVPSIKEETGELVCQVPLFVIKRSINLELVWLKHLGSQFIQTFGNMMQAIVSCHKKALVCVK